MTNDEVMTLGANKVLVKKSTVLFFKVPTVLAIKNFVLFRMYTKVSSRYYHHITIP